MALLISCPTAGSVRGSLLHACLYSSVFDLLMDDLPKGRELHLLVPVLNANYGRNHTATRLTSPSLNLRCTVDISCTTAVSAWVSGT